MTEGSKEENQATLQTFTKQNLWFLTFKPLKAKTNIEVEKAEVWKLEIRPCFQPSNFMV